MSAGSFKSKAGRRQSRGLIAMKGFVDKMITNNKLNKGKKRDGTPDKSGSPSGLTEQEESPTKNVIFNEEIEKLAIKDEELQRLRDERQPLQATTPIFQDITVRKMKPASEWNRPKPKTVHVLREAPSDALLRPMETSYLNGPRTDDNGYIIPHSLLGRVEDFEREAMLRGHIKKVEIDDDSSQSLTVKYEKKKKFQSHVHSIGNNENNALKNWQAKMAERRKQQGYISKLLDKPAEVLVMSRSDEHRKIQEERYVIDRTIPAIDYGKGYRVGSEFWKQQERFGDELSGIHMTLSQTERGYPPPIEHIGVPKMVKQEKGIDWSRSSTPLNHPWDKRKEWRNSAFLRERKEQLQSITNELDPYKPEFDGLQVTGSNQPLILPSNFEDDKPEVNIIDQPDMPVEEENDPLADHPDVGLIPIIGPSLQFGGQVARWNGSSKSHQDQIGLEARVIFETFAGKRVTSHLEIYNEGTTCLYYDWKKVPKTNPFDMINQKVQRFYFSTSSGVILPGDTVQIPFIFKSPNAGVFTEQWQFETRPVLMGGAALIVTLKGVAIKEDKYEAKRIELENQLAHKQAEQVAMQVLDSLLDGIKTPERSRSPIDFYITEEELFLRNNPGANYKFDHIENLKKLYVELFPEEERENVEWDLNLETLKYKIMEMDEENDKKQEYLARMTNAVESTSFPRFAPIKEEMYRVCYRYLMDAVDQIVSSSMLVRATLGLPDKEEHSFPEESVSKDRKKEQIKEIKLRKEKEALAAEKKTGGKGGKDAKKDDKKDAKGGGKDQKSAKGGKDAAKDKPKQVPKTPTKPPSRSASGAAAVSRPGSSRSDILTPRTKEEKRKEEEYKNRLYLLSYSVFQNNFDDMGRVFEEIKEKHDQSNL